MRRRRARRASSPSRSTDRGRRGRRRQRRGGRCAVAFAPPELKLVVERRRRGAWRADDRQGRRHRKIAVAVPSGGNVDPELFSRLVAERTVCSSLPLFAQRRAGETRPTAARRQRVPPCTELGEETLGAGARQEAANLCCAYCIHIGPDDGGPERMARSRRPIQEQKSIRREAAPYKGPLACPSRRPEKLTTSAKEQQKPSPLAS